MARPYGFGRMIIRPYNIESIFDTFCEIGPIFDLKCSDVAHRFAKPIYFFQRIHCIENHTNAIGVLVRKIDAALCPRKTICLKNTTNFDIGIVVRFAKMLFQFGNFHIECYRVHLYANLKYCCLLK